MATNKLLIYLFGLILIISFVVGVQPQQTYYKSQINPLYKESMASNTNYTYNFTLQTPDGITSVTSAIVMFNAQINGQTQNFTMWVNDKSCNNPSYYIATAFSTTGNTQIYFDCSNVITQNGFYKIVLRSAVNTGVVSGWLDITYLNNPKGSTDVFGTEYTEGDDGTIFLLLKDSNGVAVTNATCTLDIYYPNLANQSHPEWINNGLMQFKEEGLYYYDFTVPLTTGLYMVNAECSYITNNNYFYTLSSGKSTVRTVVAGTYAGDPFVLNDYGEWLYTQCDSANKVCDANYQWNISGSGNVTSLFVQYLGENNGANTMLMYYWNWTSSAWVLLPNSLTFKATGSGGVPTGVDEYLSNTIPLRAIGNGTNTDLVRVRLYTTSGSTFKQWDNWLQLRTSQYSTSLQDIKGSGEIHVSSAPAGENRYFKVLTCDGFIDGRCGDFINDETYDLQEGEILEYVNVSATSTKSDVSISYNSPFAVDCTALYNIEENINGSWVEFADYLTYSQPAYENCIITLNKDLISGTTYQFRILFDNYMKWEVDWTKKISDSVNKSVAPLCNNRNFTYVVPITDNTNTTTDLTTDFCYQFMDDQYWINSYYTDSQAVSVTGEYASYVQELRYYRSVLTDRYLFLVLGNNTGMMSDYYADKVWKNPIRNLTYYPNATVTVDTNAIALSVWNSSMRNLTYYNMTDTTDYAKLSNLSASQVWSYSARNLTYFPTQLDLTNYTYIWQFPFRYTHGVVLN